MFHCVKPTQLLLIDSVLPKTSPLLHTGLQVLLPDLGQTAQLNRIHLHLPGNMTRLALSKSECSTTLTIVLCLLVTKYYTSDVLEKLAIEIPDVNLVECYINISIKGWLPVFQVLQQCHPFLVYPAAQTATCETRITAVQVSGEVQIVTKSNQYAQIFITSYVIQSHELKSVLIIDSCYSGLSLSLLLVSQGHLARPSLL